MAKVHVPDIPHPTAKLCWQQAGLAQSLARCDRRQGHAGPHTWEMAAEWKSEQAAREDFQRLYLAEREANTANIAELHRADAELTALRERHAAAEAEVERLRGMRCETCRHSQGGIYCEKTRFELGPNDSFTSTVVCCPTLGGGCLAWEKRND